MRSGWPQVAPAGGCWYCLYSIPAPACTHLCSPYPTHVPQQASDIEKSQLADSAATQSERAAALEQELRAARDQLSSLRAVADQGRGELKAQLQRKESDLGRAAAAAEGQAALIDELKAQLEKGAQERERLVAANAQLQGQLGRRSEEGREANLRTAQLLAALEEKTAELEVAQVGAVGWLGVVGGRMGLGWLGGGCRLLLCCCLAQAAGRKALGC